MEEMGQMGLLVKLIFYMANFYYNKTTKELKMYGENEIKYDTKKLAMITIDKKDVDWDKMNFDYEIKVVNGKLVYGKKPNKILDKKKELETKLDQSSNLDEVKIIIKDLINL